MRLSRRHGLFIGIGLLLIFIAVEIQSYAFGKLSIANGNSFQFYQPDVFDLSPEQLANENTASRLGWQLNVPRPQSSELSPSCGSAFGDSMTRGDEVKDDEAWLHLLSERLGCNVQNFGVGGYGLDQAALRYELGTPPGNFVILGLFIEMLRRDLAASWTFYRGPAQNNLPTYAVTKPMYVIENDRLELIPRPTQPVTRQAIVQHHRRDSFSTRSGRNCLFRTATRPGARSSFAMLTRAISTISHRICSGGPTIPPMPTHLPRKYWAGSTTKASNVASGS